MYFTEGHTNLPREAIGPSLGSNCLSRGSASVFRRKSIATCDFPGGPDFLPLPPPPLNPPMLLKTSFVSIRNMFGRGFWLMIMEHNIHLEQPLCLPTQAWKYDVYVFGTEVTGGAQSRKKLYTLYLWLKYFQVLQ